MSNPLVSIIVTCHNRRDYLEKTMDSVFAQHYEPAEIIVMDDGSTDGTDQLMATYGDRVRYIWQETQGVAIARTRASQLANGEYIAYQDDDDLMPAERINHLYEALERFPSAIFATGDFALIDPLGNLTGKRWLPGTLEEKGEPILINDGQAAVLWPRVPAVPHTTLFRRVHGERVGWFDPEFKYACSDADFLARLGRLGPIVYLREVVSLYRRGHEALWDNEVKTSFSRLQLWVKHLGLIDRDNKALRRRLQQRIAAALRTIERGKSRGYEVDDPMLNRFAPQGLSALEPIDRIMYAWYRSIKLPVRNLIKGYN